MRFKTVCFLWDVGVRVSKNGQSYLSIMKANALQLIPKLEHGDCIVLYEKDGVGLYDNLGSSLAAVSNYNHHNFISSLALQETIKLVQNLYVEEDVHVFVVMDNYKQNMEFSFIKTFQQEKSVCDKTFYYYFYGINCEDSSYMKFESMNPRVKCFQVSDPSEVNFNLAI